MPKVSVVMPSYNSEKYIKYAFDSLINQTFTDWECIIVDDSSTDGTLSLIKEYAAGDPRFKYKQLDNNTGSAKFPRDTAVSLSESDWIVLLDSDDMLSNDAIEKLLHRQMETNAEIIILKLVRIDEKGDIINNNKDRYLNFNFDKVLSGLEATELTIGEWIISGLGLFSKEIYLKLDNYLDSCFVDINYNMDEYDTRQLFLNANKVAFVDSSYYYRSNLNSTTRTFHIKKFQILNTNKLLLELLEKHYKKNDNIFIKMKYQYISDLQYCRYMFLKYKNKIKKNEYHYIKKLLKETYNNILNLKNNTWSFSFLKILFLTKNYYLFNLTTFIIFFLKKKYNINL